MGKGARARKQRAAAAEAAPPAAGPFFHGGVPGLKPGDLLLSARQLGIAFQYHASSAPYDPSWVYLTTDEGAAQGYASRYVEFPSNRTGYGDVYEAEPLDVPSSDPDYSLVFPDAFVRCRRARITRVVATGVNLSCTEQNYLNRRYEVWDDANSPIFDDDGYIIPSKRMRGFGITREWTTLLRPWLGTKEVDADGQLLIALNSRDPWATMLYALPSLDHDCQIHRHPHEKLFHCTTCAHDTPDQEAAALHQLGEHPMRMLARIHGFPLDQALPHMVTAARRRNPARWHWLT